MPDRLAAIDEATTVAELDSTPGGNILEPLRELGLMDGDRE